MSSPFKLPLRLPEDDRHNPSAVLDADGEFQFSAPIYYGHITAKQLRREAKRDKDIRGMLEKTDHIIATVNAQPEIVAFLADYIERNTRREYRNGHVGCKSCGRVAKTLQHNALCYVRPAETLFKTLGGE